MISVLDILVSSVNDHDSHKDEDILLKIDGILCKKKTGLDLILLPTYFDPKQCMIGCYLIRKWRTASVCVCAETQNIQVLQAMICENCEDTKSDLMAFLFLEDQHVSNDGLLNSPTNKGYTGSIRTTK